LTAKRVTATRISLDNRQGPPAASLKLWRPLAQA
jgi:hypothetical protein